MEDQMKLMYTVVEIIFSIIMGMGCGFALAHFFENKELAWIGPFLSIVFFVSGLTNFKKLFYKEE